MIKNKPLAILVIYLCLSTVNSVFYAVVIPTFEHIPLTCENMISCDGIRAHLLNLLVTLQPNDPKIFTHFSAKFDELMGFYSKNIFEEDGKGYVIVDCDPIDKEYFKMVESLRNVETNKWITPSSCVQNTDTFSEDHIDYIKEIIGKPLGIKMWVSILHIKVVEYEKCGEDMKKIDTCMTGKQFKISVPDDVVCRYFDGKNGLNYDGIDPNKTKDKDSSLEKSLNLNAPNNLLVGSHDSLVEIIEDENAAETLIERLKFETKINQKIRDTKDEGEIEELQNKKIKSFKPMINGIIKNQKFDVKELTEYKLSQCWYFKSFDGTRNISLKIINAVDGGSLVLI